MFADSDLKIVAQIVLPISHCLVSRTPRAKIKRLYVHPQTLAQCRAWVQKNFPTPNLLKPPRTRGPPNWRPRTRLRRPSRDSGRGKIRPADPGSRHSGQRGQRHPLPGAGAAMQPPTGHDRTSLMLSIRDHVGALHQALAPFRRYRLNMTKIESRPSKRKCGSISSLSIATVT